MVDLLLKVSLGYFHHKISFVRKIQNRMGFAGRYMILQGQLKNFFMKVAHFEETLLSDQSTFVSDNDFQN